MLDHNVTNASDVLRTSVLKRFLGGETHGAA
jgi:hypothetical protein